MKILNFNKKIILGMVASILLGAFLSCSKKMDFMTSETVPAARGTITVKTDKNKNHAIKINITNLAEPERLQPAKKLYMVWIETDQNVTKNIGQIKTSSGTFSKTLKATFETVTTFNPKRVFITAENDSDVQVPNWEVILTSETF